MTPTEALAALSPDELRAAGAALGGEAGALLASLADARERGADPTPILEQHAALLTRLARGPGVEPLLKPRLDALAAQLGAVRGPLETALTSRDELAEGLAGLPTGTDPEVDALVRRAIDVLRADGSLSAVAALLPALDGLLADLRGVTAGNVPPDLPTRVTALEADASRAAESATRLFAETQLLLEDAATLADSRGAPTAGKLATHVAELTERLGGPVAARPKWREAFEVSLRARDAATAKQALRHVQVGAMDAQDWPTLASWSHRLADLAESVGDRALAITTRAEETLLLARIPRHVEDARFMAGRVLRDAEGLDVADRALVDWWIGQLYDKLGDAAAAGPCFARVVNTAEHAAPNLHGRACLSLGLLAERRNDLRSARELLRRAWENGRSRGDFALFSAAVPALLGRLVADGDDDVAAQVARDAANRYAAAGLADAFWSEMQSRFGAARVRPWRGG